MAPFGLHELLKRILWICTPSYVQALLNGKPAATAGGPAARTAYLDGLRGVAALFVFIGHTMWTYHAFVEYSYGDGPGNMRFIQMPPIRLFFSGHTMVSLFFVVGGYVSSAKAIKLARSRAHEKVYLTLTSSLFRRVIRLYLPAWFSSFISFNTLRLGMWESSRRFIQMPYMSHPDYHPEILGTYCWQLKDWFNHAMGLMNIWSYYNVGFGQPYYNPYDPHLWTVPMEMRGSLCVMLALLAFCRCRVPWRFVFMAASTIFCVYWDRWECMEFLLGAMLAEIYMVFSELGQKEVDTGRVEFMEINEQNNAELRRRMSVEEIEATDYLLLKPVWATNSPSQTVRRWMSNEKMVRNFQIGFFIFALYVFSCPAFRFEFSPGYQWMGYMTPSRISDPKRWWHGIGSALLIASIQSTPTLQKPFDHPFSQYLGKISYALYICHGPVIHIVGMSLTPKIWAVTGYDTMSAWLFGFFVGFFVLSIVTFVAADLFWRVIDLRCVAFARWVEGVCFTE